ncbi:MAG TPA: DUF6680 family protein [Dokdonella sp.]|uniref:DUF6680 family protein n=1 Tax=Dokdonella sp. TaxID=2291710 RepID=UPI002C01CAB6|nr:DUF6680 family protein [Dokdonella sp.]HUD41967.1 DUF6680 family protein [Dokdonella sp.]
MDASSWAIVLATFTGPLAAVVVSLWRESRKERRDAQMRVFGTLMASRGSELHLDSVRALNSVQVAFTDHEHVLDAWRDLMAHVNAAGMGSPDWLPRYHTCLIVLLSVMATALGKKALARELRIGRFGAYAPRAWADHEQRVSKAYEYVALLAAGKASLPVFVTQVAEIQALNKSPSGLPSVQVDEARGGPVP